MKCIALVLLLAALAFAPAPASAANDIVFVKLATDEGCGFYWAISKEVAAEQNKRLHYSWSVPCRKGQLINGPGTLTEKWREAEKWRDGQSDNTSRFVGTMVDGVFDGPLTWFIGGRRNAGVDSAAMGCFYYKPENHPWYKKCAPRTPASHSEVSNASASSASAARSAGNNNNAMIPLPSVAACAQYSLLPQQANYKYFQIFNTCHYAILVYAKVQESGRWTTYADMNQEIGPLATAKSRGVLSNWEMQVTLMAVCPSRQQAEFLVQKKVAGVYTGNGQQWGCWYILENGPVGTAN